MKKMLPEGAVRQKMTVDGFTDAEIDNFFAGKPLSAAAVKKAAPAGGGGLLGEIAKGKKLEHVTEIHDSSGPVLTAPKGGGGMGGARGALPLPGPRGAMPIPAGRGNCR